MPSRINLCFGFRPRKRPVVQALAVVTDLGAAAVAELGAAFLPPAEAVCRPYERVRDPWLES